MTMGKGRTIVPLEVAPPCFDDDVSYEEAEAGYQHHLLSRRVGRPQQSYAGRLRRSDQAVNPSRRRLVGGLIVGCVIAGLALWGWALVVLLCRLSALRHGPETPQVHVEPRRVQGPPQQVEIFPTQAGSQPLMLPAPPGS
eukprot:TRINITY_DN85511_c0_g1_i1.p1 TRINITY_DN85511_c0_g1~~TRINITY_DN85511_c0_g1_i1.p1  ORF type:complete len:140 (-),score=18.96 TRINITY_DN85511_c0_g1_i1:65-484(-)